MDLRNIKYLLKKFPVKVVIQRNLNNVLTPAETFKGMTEVEVMHDESGQAIERAYLIIKMDGKYRKIPRPPQNAFYSMPNGQRIIYILMYDADTFYPMILSKGETRVMALVRDIDEKGEFKKDAAGNFIVTEREFPILTARFINESGKLIELPTGIGYKTFDKEQWLGTELSLSAQMYKSKNWLTQYAPHLLIILFGLFMMLVAYIMMQGMEKVAAKNMQAAESIASSNMQFLDKWADIVSKQEAQGAYSGGSTRIITASATPPPHS